MKEEILDIVDQNGKPTGKTAPKPQVHKLGLYHNTIHLWLYTKEGEILLAQRSAKKAICPSMWDVSVAGHIDAGETFTKALTRECFEELGITVLEKNLTKIGVFECFQSYDNCIIDNEFHHVYISELKTEMNNFKLQEDEVDGVKLVSAEAFFQLLKDSETNNHFVASNYKYYEFVVSEIQKMLRQ